MISRILAGALALAFLCAPAVAGTCGSPAKTHDVLDELVRDLGGEVFTINGAEAKRIGTIVLIQAGWPPSEAITLLMVHRTTHVASVVVFVDNCARYMVQMPARRLDLLSPPT